MYQLKDSVKENQNQPVYKSLIEIGKANKSIFLFEYIKKN